MGIPAAILVGAVIIATAMLVTSHWQVMPAGYQGVAPMAYRLNRWTGLIDMCVVDPATMRNPDSFVGAQLACVTK